MGEMSVQGERREFVESVLRDYKDITRKALQPFMQSKEPRRYLYDLIPSYPMRGGKGLRSGLCIATCLAFGGNIENVLKSAIAIELFHNAFLIHDDIEDGSEYRRGKPTLHAEHGLGIAVNVGDALSVLSIRPLMENLNIIGSKLTWEVFAEIEYMATQSVEGQAMELGWVRDNKCDLSEEDYLRMILKKTCWYTCIQPCRIGALIGSRGSLNLNHFNRFGYYMGAAFQIQDDVLNLVGEQKKYGKEIGGDIYEGKRTLILVYTLSHCDEDEKEQMKLFLSTPRKNRLKEDVKWVYHLMGKYKSIAYAQSCARQLAGAALREFDVAYGCAPDTEDKRFIRDLILYMIERDI
jgi:geranylgeranyl diphosphate synthase type II